MPVTGPLRRLKTSALARLPGPRHVAIAAGALILVLGAVGAVDLLAPSLPLASFSLEGERTFTGILHDFDGPGATRSAAPRRRGDGRVGGMSAMIAHELKGPLR